MPPLMPAMTLRGGETTEITGAWAARPARGGPRRGRDGGAWCEALPGVGENDAV